MQDNRIQSVDLLKIIAMVGVVATHSIEVFRNTLFENALYLCCTFTIPLFFITSGYLQLGKKEGNYKYSITKIYRIIKYIFIVTVSYTLIKWLFSLIFGLPISIDELFYNTFGSFVSLGEFWVFWYFSALILVYLLYPPLNRLYQHKFDRFLVVFGALLFIELTVMLLNLTTDNLIVKHLSNQRPLEAWVPQRYRIWDWLFYFCLGGVLKKSIDRIRSFKAKSLWINFLIVWVLCLSLELLFFNDLRSYFFEYYYCSYFVIAYSTSICLLVLNHDIGGNKTVARLNTFFLPVYSFHIIVMVYLLQYKPMFETLGNAAGIVFFLITLTITMAISYVLLKIPVVKNVFKI